MTLSVTIREAMPADAAGIARVHVESWRTTYPGIMPQAHLDALSVADYEQTWQSRLREDSSGNTRSFVAVDEGGEIVGFVRGGPPHLDDPEYTAEIYTLYLLKSQQGCGLGRLLLAAVAKRLHEDGHTNLFLWTHVRNPARAFYEKLGGVAVRTTQRTLKGIVYDDVGYGWDKAALERLIKE
jgi:ribosomal protein S18 acetylase RimI-like enzyme